MNYPELLKQWNKDKNKFNSVENVEKTLHSFKVLFAYNSGKIENDRVSYYDTREIFDNGKVISYTGDLKTLFEQQNQKDCYDYLKNLIVQKEPITIELIKKIHFELTKGTYDEKRYGENEERPGEFKKHDYVVGRNEVGFMPDEIEPALTDLLKEVNDPTVSKEPLLAASYLHAVFENIHPFADGNGRVGRTLMNYYLMINDHPPVIVYEEDRIDYYKALEINDTTEDIMPLYNFMKEQCVKTWEKRKL